MKNARGVLAFSCRVLWAAALLILFASLSAASGKFIPVFETDEYRIFLNSSTLRRNKDVVTSAVHYTFSEEGLKAVRAALPSRHRKKDFQTEVDFFNYDLKKRKYNVKVSALHDGNNTPVYREGSTKWLPVKDGTLAAVVVNAMLTELGIQ